LMRTQVALGEREVRVRRTGRAIGCAVDRMRLGAQLVAMRDRLSGWLKRRGVAETELIPRGASSDTLRR
jgi:hypothetical protein